MYSAQQQISLPNSLLQLINEIIWTTTLDGQLLYANPALERIYGRPLADFRTDPWLWLAVIHPDDQSLARRHHHLLLEQGQTEATYRMIRPDGQTRWLRNQMHLLYDDSGQPHQIGGITCDITAQKYTEEALRESEERYRTLVENSPNGIIVLQKGRYIFANPAGAGLLGYEPDELIGAAALDTIHPDSQQLALARVQLTEQGQVNSPVEMKVLHKDGSILFSESVSVPITLNGQPAALILSQDITARKKAEEALQEHEANLVALIENTDDRIWSVDRHYRLIIGNKPFCQSMRASLGRDLQPGDQVLLDSLPPGMKAEWQGYYDRALAGECFSVEIETHFAQEPGYRDSRFNPIRISNGQIVGVSVTSRDTTERKQMEATLRVNLEKYRVLFESFPLGITVADKTGQVIETNEQAARILGIPREEHDQRDIDGPQWQIVRPDGTPMPPEEFASVRALRENRLVENVEMGIVKSADKTTWISVTAAPLPLDESGVVVTYGDITERKRAQAVLEARLRLSEFANHHNMDELMQKTLDEIELLTGSQIGFFHFLEADQQTLLLQTWSTNTLENICTAEGKGLHYNVAEAGVWADCVRFRRPIIHQDYAGLTERKGLPAGHAPVIRELVVPIAREGQIKAILGVGNKPTEYEAKDLEAVSTLSNMAWDIILRQQAEENLRASLREKEILLKEIHHRVKNNLQFVSSLLNLQAQAAQDERVRAMLADSQQRLRGMAMVHERLYRSTDLGRIQFKTYVQDLISQLRASLMVTAQLVTVQLDLAEVTLPVDTAIPCGLIINELVSNTFKYAFPDRRPGELRINLRVEPENWLTLQVSDNGIGLPETVDYRQTTSLGLQLVNLLIRQLRGTLKLDQHGGTTFTLTFPLKTGLNTETLTAKLKLPSGDL